jgi:hypothetical protein
VSDDRATGQGVVKVSASSTKTNNGPAWLDQVLGCLSPAFSFRNGGSAITGNIAADRKPTQQSAAILPTDGTAKPKGRQRG